ncbi:hypothetical protein [Kolpuevirus frurule]|uniref:Uncharacterized protein n=1 Tax=Kolpuevirus sp. 'frurule' TaxID=3028514 RepID=A0AAF0IQS7_9CAUD|nr:hypothetical protein [Kolpuevirus sp. 'frurule']
MLLNIKVMSEIIIVLILIVASIGLVWLLYKANELQKKNIYVYPKTKNKYLVKGIVKMKDTLSLEWIDAVLYISLKNGNYYAREEKQFFDKFITLKEWEKQDGTKSR